MTAACSWPSRRFFGRFGASGRRGGLPVCIPLFGRYGRTVGIVLMLRIVLTSRESRANNMRPSTKMIGDVIYPTSYCE